MSQKAGDNKKPEVSLPRKTVSPPRIESTPFKMWVDEKGNLVNETKPGFCRTESYKHVTGIKDFELAQQVITSGLVAIQSTTPCKSTEKGTREELAQNINLVVQTLHDFQPKDAIEARLVLQAAAAFEHGMNRLFRAGNSDQITQSEAQINMATKMLRLHNETIEALSRYRRGGEQKVIVQHVTADKAIVNQFNGNQFRGEGGIKENKGNNPCSESAAPKPDQTVINHVASPQWPTADAASTVGCVQVPKQKKASAG